MTDGKHRLARRVFKLCAKAHEHLPTVCNSLKRQLMFRNLLCGASSWRMWAGEDYHSDVLMRKRCFDVVNGEKRDTYHAAASYAKTRGAHRAREISTNAASKVWLGSRRSGICAMRRQPLFLFVGLRSSRLAALALSSVTVPQHIACPFHAGHIHRIPGKTSVGVLAWGTKR